MEVREGDIEVKDRKIIIEGEREREIFVNFGGKRMRERKRER